MRTIKPGDVFIRRREYEGKTTTTTTLVITAPCPYRVTEITISEYLGCVFVEDKKTTFKDSIGGERADWTAWAEAVGKLTDYLLALPAEVME